MKPQLINDHPIHKQSCNMRLRRAGKLSGEFLKKVVEIHGAEYTALS